MTFTLLDTLAEWLERHRTGGFVPIEYFDDYDSLVAFTDGYFLGRSYEPDPQWNQFVRWLELNRVFEGSEGWRIGVKRSAEAKGASAASEFWRLLEAYRASTSPG